MKQKFFVLGAIALIAVVGLFIFEHATSAQRPDREAQRGQGQRGERPGGDRGNRGMMEMISQVSINPVSIVENSWIDLSFKVGVDDEALVNARPIYQETRENFEMKMKEIRGKYAPKIREAFASDDRRAAFQKAQAIRQEMEKEVSVLLKSGGTEFQAGLKKVLSKEQLTKLNELTRERQTAQRQQRANRFRGGEGGQRGGEGGQRGQRRSQ